MIWMDVALEPIAVKSRGGPISEPVVRASIGSDHGPGPAEVNARTRNRYNEPGMSSPISARVLGLTPSRVPRFQSSRPVRSYSY